MSGVSVAGLLFIIVGVSVAVFLIVRKGKRTSNVSGSTTPGSGGGHGGVSDTQQD